MKQRIRLPSIHDVLCLGQSPPAKLLLPGPTRPGLLKCELPYVTGTRMRTLKVSSVFSLYLQLRFLTSNFNITYTIFIALLPTVPN